MKEESEEEVAGSARKMIFAEHIDKRKNAGTYIQNNFFSVL